MQLMIDGFLLYRAKSKRKWLQEWEKEKVFWVGQAICQISIFKGKMEKIQRWKNAS